MGGGFTCNQDPGVVRLREGRRVEAGVRGDLPGGEADVSHGHGEGLAAARRRAEQGLLGHLAEGSDEGHICVWGRGGKRRFIFSEPANWDSTNKANKEAISEVFGDVQ